MIENTCVLEQHVGASRASGLQIDEGSDAGRPLAGLHEAMRSSQDCLLSTIQQQQERHRQLDVWVCHNHTRYLQRRPHACSAIRCA